MRDSYNSCILEFLGHKIEDLLLSEHVNVSSRLIKDYNFVLSQNSAANANQLLFPTDTLLPPSSIRICKPVLLASPLVSNSSRPALFRRPKSYVFENLPSGSRFLRKVSLNSTGSWGITVSFDLKSLRFIYLMLVPSIKISPSEISMIRLNARATVDLPAPLLPHKPTFCPF